jgi:hypothetical protein
MILRWIQINFETDLTLICSIRRSRRTHRGKMYSTVH